MNSEQTCPAEAIAIVGISCLLPDADTPEQYWANLVAGVDSIRPASEADWRTDPAALLRDGKGTLDATSSILGGWRKDIPAENCALDPDEVAKLDRMFRWVLDCGDRALCDAGIGITDPTRSRCANILAAYSWSPTFSSAELLQALYVEKLQSTLASHPQLAEGLASLAPNAVAVENACVAGMLASVTAKGLKLDGPCYAIDAACASSLYGLKLGSLHLRSRHCDFALVNGISAGHPAFATLGFSALQALPEKSRSRPLDATSDGLAPAEGCVSLVLQRLEDAQRDGRQIHGVIRSIGLSNDGKGRHLLAPKSAGQQIACQRALEEAGVTPDSIDYIDCHATGTSVGDLTELETLAALYPPGQFPLIGSVKSNFGHLLTAAGLAGALKILLGMKAGTHAPTIAIQDPLTLPARPDVAENMVRAPMPWPERAGRRRAAVNAFGFGGANSQVIIDQKPQDKPLPAATLQPIPLLVTGMAGHFGDCRDLGAIQDRAFSATPSFSQVPAPRWEGLNPLGTTPGSDAAANPIVEIDLDALRCQLVPESLGKMNPQQLVMLDVADQALQDSGIERGGRVAVIISHAEDLIVHRLQLRWQIEAMVEKVLRQTGLDLSAQDRAKIIELLKEAMHPPVGGNDFASYIGNLMASRIASQWDFSGPAFSLTAQESSSARGLQIARMLMASGEAEAVLLGAVDLAVHAENVLVRHLLDSSGSHDIPPCDGAGALVLEPLSTKSKNVYATIESEALGHKLPASDHEEAEARVLAEAMAGANCQPSDISLFCSDDPKAAMANAGQVFPSSPVNSVCLANSTEIFGNSHAASQMLDLILAASALHRRYLPPAGRARDWPELPAPFYLTETAVPWTRGKHHPRIAAIQSSDSTGTASCMVLSDRHRRPASLRVETVPAASRYVIPLQGDDAPALVKELSTLKGELAAGEALEKLSLRSFDDLDRESSRPIVALCAADPQTMGREIDSVAKHLRANPDQPWLTPNGSRFSPQPLGGTGQVAFVYPPFDTPYPGMQADLYTLFPKCMDRIDAAFSDSEKAMCAQRVFPRFPRFPTAADKEQREHQLHQSTFEMLRAGVAHSVSSTIAIRDVIGIQPTQAFGYSFGEISMLMAMGVWPMEPGWIEAIEKSGLLTRDIGGKHLAANDFFSGGSGGSGGSQLEWASRVVLLSMDEVTEKLRGRERVFVSQASTRSETVICGALPDVLKACDALGADSLRMENPLAVHCPVTQSVSPKLRTLLRMESKSPGNTRLRFSGGDTPETWSDAAVADVIAKGIAGLLDFPRLVDKAYDSGARIFIELGARNTCTRRISSILGDRAHLAIAVDQRGATALDSYAMLVAACLAHQVAFNTKAWTGMLKPERAFGLKLTKTIARTQETPREEKPLPTHSVSTTRETTHRNSSARHMAWLTHQRTLLRDHAPPTRRREKTEDCLFDEAAVMEFAEGKLARVFGPKYAEFDRLPQRMRLPSPPFLALSRVLSIDAKPFALEPCSIITEFDLPKPYWGQVGDHASFMAADAQGVLFLLGYIGIDQWLEGIRTYRWLDAKMNFTGRPLPTGATIRYDIRIRSFTRHGGTLLFVTDFDCDVNGQRFLEIRDCTAGFFTDEELEKGQGLASVPYNGVSQDTNLPRPLSKKTELTEDDLTAWQHGDLATCFGDSHAGMEKLHPSLRLVPGPMRMIDRIVHLAPPCADSDHLVAEKWLDPGDWYLRSHFKDAPVFAGPCMVEGCFQALQCYALYLGLPDGMENARFSPADDCRMEVKFRGQVPAERGTFTMRMRATAIEYGEVRSLQADFDLVYKKRIIGRVTGLGIKLEGARLSPAKQTILGREISTV